MRQALALGVLLAAMALPVSAQVIKGAPPGWQFGGDIASYDVGTAALPRMQPGTQVAYLKAGDKADCGTYAALFQVIRADAYRGQRVQLSAHIIGDSSNNPNSFALFLFVRGPDGASAPRRVFMPAAVGDGAGFEWRKVFTTQIVPQDAQEIVIGYRLSGPRATALIDEVRFETVPTDVHRTQAMPSVYFNRRSAIRDQQFRGIRCGTRTDWLSARSLRGQDERDLLKTQTRAVPRDVLLALSR